MVQKDGRNPLQNSAAAKEIGRDITIYTDPLCCWTWAMRPQLEQLLDEMQPGAAHLQYKMGGLLPSWSHFDDALNSIRKPVQMGPEWMHCKVMSGRPINDKIWITDPPASSFPACIAVKSVELQSPQLSRCYFNALQAAVMTKNQNIAKTAVLLEVAGGLANAHPDFDLFLFRNDLLGVKGKEAFRKDLQECKYLNIGRLPTILFRTSTKQSILLSGYQSYESLRNAWMKLN